VVDGVKDRLVEPACAAVFRRFLLPAGYRGPFFLGAVSGVHIPEKNGTDFLLEVRSVSGYEVALCFHPC
jgi:hypothetical protein